VYDTTKLTGEGGGGNGMTGKLEEKNNAHILCLLYLTKEKAKLGTDITGEQ
jgi:hypothetical protein